MGAQDVIEGGAAWTVEQGNCLELLRGLPEGRVHVCVTSPPYWQLRSYLPKGHEYKGLEIGSESTLDAYIERLVCVFREVRRVLHPEGTLWLNAGITYSSGKVGKGGGKVGASVVLDGDETYALRDDLSREDLVYVLSELAAHARKEGEVR